MEERKTKVVGRLWRSGTIIKQIWNILHRGMEKQIWKCLGFSEGICPLKLSLSRFEENTAVSNSSGKTNLHAEDVLKAFFTKERAHFSAIKDEEVKSVFIEYEKAKERGDNSVVGDVSSKERILEETIKKVASFIERIMHFGKRDKRILWAADMTGAAVLHPGNPQLRTLNLHGKDVLNAFFSKELKCTLCSNNTPFFPSLTIIAAEMAAKRKKHERRQAAQQANFLRLIRAMKKNDKI